MQLQLCTWSDIEVYLGHSTGIIIPLGSTEQHGPNGLIGTDAICPEVIARGVAKELDSLVAPTISVGMAQHHLGFPGSISFRPSTLLLVVKDIVNSLARHGFDRFYFLNGHGGNIATVTAAFAEIYADRSFELAPRSQPRLRCRLANWWEAEGVKQLSHELFGEAEGSHATPSEVSLSFFAYPEAARAAEANPPIAPTGEILDAEDYRQRFPDGRIGSNPSLATVEAGEKLYKCAVASIARDYQSFLNES